MQGDEVHVFLLFADTFLEDGEVVSSTGAVVGDTMGKDARESSSSITCMMSVLATGSTPHGK
jgi:hypothetical protein